MKNNATCTIRSEKITIDMRICAALAANRGGEVYLAAIAPDMELTVITLDEAPGILPCFEEDEGTYDTPGKSHVGIYLGNGMMVSAGDPIKYADIHSSYWQKYLSGFGRLSK